MGALEPQHAWTERRYGAGSWLSHLWPRLFSRRSRLLVARAGPGAYVVPCARSMAGIASVGQGWEPSGWQEGRRLC